MQKEWNLQSWKKLEAIYNHQRNDKKQFDYSQTLFMLPINELDNYQYWMTHQFEQNIFPNLHELKQFNFFDLVKRLYSYILPMTYVLEKRLSSNQNLLLGLNGMQGSGKTTFGILLTWVFLKLGYTMNSLSIDDFYKTYEERDKLNKDIYLYRGPPGSHSLDLLIRVLMDWKDQNKELIQVPIFDKSLRGGQGDRVGYKDMNGQSQILLLEGWMVGFREVNESLIKEKQKNLILPDGSLVQDLDLMLYMNKQLSDYERVWNKLDYSISFQAEDIQYSYEWRLEAERKMRRVKGQGMSDNEVLNMVSYYWKCLHPEIYVNSDNLRYNVKLMLDENRSVIGCQL